MMMDIFIDENASNLIGGLFGSVAAIATKPPLTVREGMWRCLCGVILALSATSWACQWIGIEPASYSKVTAIACLLGFCGFHILTCLMIILDAGVARVNESKLGVLPDIIDFIRGKRGEK